MHEMFSNCGNRVFGSLTRTKNLLLDRIWKNTKVNLIHCQNLGKKYCNFAIIKKVFLKLVCNFAMICDSSLGRTKTSNLSCFAQRSFSLLRRIRPTIFDPWREFQPSGGEGGGVGRSNIREMQLREKTSL